MIRYLITDGGSCDPLLASIKLGSFYPLFKTQSEAHKFLAQLEETTGEELKDLFVLKVKVKAVPQD